MKKILQVSEAFGGGIFHSVTRLCKSIENDFCFVFLLSIRSEAPADFKEHFPSGSIFYNWSAGKAINPLSDLKALIELIRLIKKEMPDVVHAHSSKAGALVRIATFFVNVPVVYSPRGYAFLRLDFSLLKRALFYMIEFILGRTRSLTVACSLGELIKARAVSKRAILISNMISLEDFKNINSKVPDQNAWINVMVGRLCKQKNPQLFFDIAQHYQNSRMKFLWIGDVGHGEKFEKHGIPENVEITGWLPRNKVLDLVANCRLFIQTSLWEGLPIALLEAMVLEKAILAKPCVGNTELVTDGYNGFICKYLNDFIKKIDLLSSDVKLLEELGKNGRVLINNRYSSLNVKYQWQSLYMHFERYNNYLNY